jgi:EpsG family
LGAVAYISACLSAVLLSYIKPSWDAASAFLLAVVLSFFCGFRLGGIDYDNYIVMFDYIRVLNDEDWSVLLELVKEPGMVVAVNFASLYDDSDTAVFVLMALLGFVPKAALALMLPKYKSLFVVLYAIFLAPGLEFAAIRSAVGIGFLGASILSMFAMPQRTALFLASISIHFSMVIGVLLLFRRFWKLVSSNLWIAPLIALIITIVGIGLIKNMFSQRDLESGNMLAPLFGLATMIALFFFTRQKFDFANTLESDRYRASIAAATFFTSLAIMMAIPISTTSIRFLEVALFFTFFSVLIASARNRLNDISVLSVFLLLSLMIYINIDRTTWLLMVTESLW